MASMKIDEGKIESEIPICVKPSSMREVKYQGIPVRSNQR